ncbi:MoaD/ThiS family protein [Dehalococcoidia bacterium]|nr:MoaD/ThiS family protein [Dehalococcoidia bacterium]
MKVKLSFTADLKYLVKGEDGAVVVETGEPLSLREILESLGVPPDKVVFGAVDKQLKRLDYVPRDGETVLLLPPISGG